MSINKLMIYGAYYHPSFDFTNLTLKCPKGTLNLNTRSGSGDYDKDTKDLLKNGTNTCNFSGIKNDNEMLLVTAKFNFDAKNNSVTLKTVTYSYKKCLPFSKSSVTGCQYAPEGYYLFDTGWVQDDKYKDIDSRVCNVQAGY